MCAFSPLSLFKAKSKVFAKKNGIKLYAAREQLAQNAGFSSYHSMLASKYKPYFCESLFESTLGIRCLHDIPDEKDVSEPLSNRVVQEVREEMLVPANIDLSVQYIFNLHVAFSYETGVASISAEVDVSDAEEEWHYVHGFGTYWYAADVEYEVKFRNEVWSLVPNSIEVKRVRKPSNSKRCVDQHEYFG